jgi:MoxR-like ATPase
MDEVRELERARAELREAFQAVKAEVAKAVVGHAELVEHVFFALVCGGHCLLEGVPGLGKTLLVRTLGEILDLSFSRIQFTPDLMPADITGTNVLVEDHTGKKFMDFQRGPIFAHIVLADEINRATPKTQSALLEAMQEQSVTVGGRAHPLASPFMVLATQNPIEMEGTYPLPEAQVDRFFFKLVVRYPSRDELGRIADLTTAEAPARVEKVLDREKVLEIRRAVRSMPLAEPVKQYAVALVLATHPEQETAVGLARKYVRYGASPRGLQSLILAAKARALLAGRPNVSFEDLRAVALPSLRHRLILNLAGEAEGIGSEAILGEVLDRVPEIA